jgi:hypothetical protein
MFLSKKYVSITIFLFLVGLNTYAQELPVKAGNIVELCYQFKFKTADSLMAVYFSEMKQGEELELYMLKANIYWWKIISGINDKTAKANYYKALSKAESYFDKEKETGAAHLYKGITLYGYMARMDGLNKNYLQAFLRVNSCLKYLEKSFGSETKYPFFYLSSGLYNYHIVVTAKKYPVLAPYLYLYPKGDKKKGVEYLQTAAKNTNKYLSTEGNYFLMKIFLEEKKYDKAMQHVNVLTERFPQNAIFLYYKFYIYMYANKPKEAASIAARLINELKNNAQINGNQIAHFESLIKEDNVNYNKQK